MKLQSLLMQPNTQLSSAASGALNGNAGQSSNNKVTTPVQMPVPVTSNIDVKQSPLKSSTTNVNQDVQA